MGEGNAGDTPAAKAAGTLSDKEMLERAIGIEPTTFSLGSLRRSLIFLAGVPLRWAAAEAR
jgi:hypothetical protein